jgi:two-component system LytT family sensor kinase
VEPTVDAITHTQVNGVPAAPAVSAHFVNNVLAAAASYIDEDPDYARDVLAELGQFLSYRLRESPSPVGAAQELAHTASYLRLQQARFPDRIGVELPDAADVRGRVAPGTIQEPVAALLGRRLSEEAGPCAVALRPANGGLELEVSGAGRPQDNLSIPLTEVTT